MDTPNLSAGLLGPAPMSSVQTAGGLSSSWGESSIHSVIIDVLGNVLLMFCVCLSQEEEEEVQPCQETTSWAKIRSATQTSILSFTTRCRTLIRLYQQNNSVQTFLLLRFKISRATHEEKDGSS